MIERDPVIQSAEERSRAARVELRAAFGAATDWFSPHRLKAEAAMAATQQIDEAKAALRRSVTRHPLKTWSVFALVASLLTFALRRPVAALAHTGFDAIRSLRKRIERRKKKL